MYPASFDYFAPTTLDEALGLLEQYGPEAKVLAGGQSLIPLMKLRFASPQVVVDINGVPGLDRLEVADGALHIGALVRHRTATPANGPVAPERIPWLATSNPRSLATLLA